eukprot:scaffold14806_cov50-Phaeocystis_antarctica.AAC.4
MGVATYGAARLGVGLEYGSPARVRCRPPLTLTLPLPLTSSPARGRCRRSTRRRRHGPGCSPRWRVATRASGVRRSGAPAAPAALPPPGRIDRQMEWSLTACLPTCQPADMCW